MSAGDSNDIQMPQPLRPGPLEVACGLAIGVDPGVSPWSSAEYGTPRAAMEAVIAKALASPPCVVSFSGGRDSSAVLATATLVARKEGLPLPVPVTNRFADVVSSHEDDWQEQVVSHLGVPDWVRLSLTDEVDSIGPLATDILTELGLLWPFNTHFHAPILRVAPGGAVLTGVGGDQLFGAQAWSSARLVLTRRRPPSVSRIGAIGVALAPRPVRQWALARRRQLRFPWLWPAVEHEIARRRAEYASRMPIAWGGGLRAWWRSRDRSVLAASMSALADYAGTTIVHPFLDPSVVGAVARHFGARGPLDRTEAMRDLFADVLPPAVVARRSKSSFDAAFFSTHSRAFAATWTGTGVDPSIVDAERLAEEWRSEHPDPRSFLLLQRARLSSLASHDRPTPSKSPGPAWER